MGYIEQFNEFKGKYPPEKYMVLSPFRMLRGFMGQIFSIKDQVLEFDLDPAGGDFYWQEKPLWKTRYGKPKGKIYHCRQEDKPHNDATIAQAGSLSFTADALGLIGTELGIKWLPNRLELGTGRLDDGSDPWIIEFAAGGNLIGVSGMQPIIRSVREDLHLEYELKLEYNLAKGMDQKEAEHKARISCLNMQKKIHSKVETKAQNRVIRYIANIRGKYKVSRLYYKEGDKRIPKKWVLLVVEFDPKPQNESDRRAMFQSAVNSFLPAFPDQRGVGDDSYQLPDVDDVKVLEAGNGVVENADDELADDNSQQDDGGDNAEISDETNGDQPSGDDEDAAEFPPLYYPDKQWAIKSVEDSIRRLSKMDILQRFAEAGVDYDVEQDPLGIKPLLDSDDKEKIVYGYMKLMVYNLNTKEGDQK